MYLIAYVVSIVFLNWSFYYVPIIDIGFGLFAPMAIVSGLIFVLRDFAQREHGHLVLAGMAAGAVLSYLMADPVVAIASVTAFAVSEGLDYLIFSVTNKPFKDRVLISSAIAVPVDTFVFWYIMDDLTPGTLIVMIVTKMIAAVAIWFYYRRREPLALA